MGSPSAQLAPDHKALLLSGLLLEYLSDLADARKNATEKQHIRLRLELQIESISLLSPSTAFYLLQSIDGAFPIREDYSGMAPAIDWYMDFLSGRDERWLNEVSTSRLSQIWKALPESPIRAKVLRTLLLVEVVTISRQPAMSMIVRMYSEAGTAEDFSGDRSAIVRCLVQEALGSPESLTADVANPRFFSLRVLRYCLQPEPRAAISPEAVQEALGIVADLGEQIRGEFEATLTRSDYSP